MISTTVLIYSLTELAPYGKIDSKHLRRSDLKAQVEEETQLHIYGTNTSSAVFSDLNTVLQLGCISTHQ